MEACCIIFLMCFLSISKPSKTFHNAAIWGQCWPPRPQHRQMGYIHTSGGSGRERKCRKQENWWNNEGKEECKRKPERTKKAQRQCGWMQERRWFYNYTSFTDQHCMYNWKMKSVLSLSRCTIAHLHTHIHPPWRHLTALTHLRALFQAQPITSLSAPGIPIAPVTMRSYG